MFAVGTDFKRLSEFVLAAENMKLKQLTSNTADGTAAATNNVELTQEFKSKITLCYIVCEIFENFFKVVF